MTIKRCPIAPDGEDCLWGDGEQCMACGVHRLYAAIHELKTSLPVIGKLFEGEENYRCPSFEPLPEKCKSKTENS